MKKERIEDLGRLAELLDYLLDEELFDLYEDSFIEKYSDKDNLPELYRKMKFVYSKLSDCWQIARWGDDE